MALFSPALGAFVAVFLLLLFYLIQTYLQNRNKLPLPPSPAGWPILGNTIEVLASAKKQQMHSLLGKWAREHGEIMCVQVGPVASFYLNSDLAVKAIFDKSSALTSEIPGWIVSNELLCNKWNLWLLNASDPRWTLQRQIIHSGITSILMADAGVPFLHYEITKFMHEVAHDTTAGTPSQDLWTQIGWYTYSNFAKQAFGFSIPDANDCAIQYIHNSGFRQIVGTLPGNHIVDIMPFLENLPLALKPWERERSSISKTI